MIQTHIHHDGSASVHGITHPKRLGRISAYLSPGGTLVDAECHNGTRAVRLSEEARAYALKGARAAVLLTAVHRQEMSKVPWVAEATGVAQQPPSLPFDAITVARNWREGRSNDTMLAAAPHGSGMTVGELAAFWSEKISAK